MELLEQINKLYNLQVKTSEKVTKGFLSENHILTDGKEKYFLKRYRFNNRERIEEIHTLKKYFADGGIPVILPLINSNQETYFLFEGGFYALFPFINDKQLETEYLDKTAIKSLGEMLGRIHKLGSSANLPIKERFKPWSKTEALGKVKLIEAEIAKLEVLTDFDKIAQANIELKKQLILNNSTIYDDLALPSNTLIHGDYLFHNVFFDQNNQVSWVFDFEKTDYSPKTYELFRSMIYSLFNGDITNESLIKAKLYLDSYLTNSPVTQDELKRGLKLYFLKAIHGFWVESEHYLKNNNRVDHFLEIEFKRLKFLTENLTKIEEKLFS
jgi:Ser/Thr protein kinase RdoA (MazF antagonist)